jgi:hypothetical protein
LAVQGGKLGHAEAGPLFYLPSSQMIPPYLFSNGTIRAIPAEMDKCHAYLDKAIAERGIKRETFLGRKGDVFIWSCQIAHGGTPIRDPKRTRKSLVTHYWRANDMARHKLDPESGGYYFAKDHQPVSSEPAWKRLADRAWLEALDLRGGSALVKVTTLEGDVRYIHIEVQSYRLLVRVKDSSGRPLPGVVVACGDNADGE